MNLSQPKTQMVNGFGLNLQPRGYDEDRLYLPTDPEHHGQRGYNHGKDSLGYARPSVAAFWLEYGLSEDVSCDDRFDTRNAQDYYVMLAEAYRRKATLFRKLIRIGKSNLSLTPIDQRQEAEITRRNYLNEHGAVEISEAEQLAEHYRLKALIVKTHLIAKGIKPSDELIDIQGKPIKQ